MGPDTDWKVPVEYDHVISFGRLPDDNLNIRRYAAFCKHYYCKHYYGAPYCVLKDPANPSLPEFAGITKSHLSTDSNDVCKCIHCGRVFSEEEQVQMGRLIAYLNTPHYCSEEDMSHHEEWHEICAFYDQGYLDENEPFQLFNLEKAVELSKGIEPVWYNIRPGINVILSAMKWKDGAWRIGEKMKGLLRRLIR